jgi:hypothetical protein
VGGDRDWHGKAQQGTSKGTLGVGALLAALPCKRVTEPKGPGEVVQRIVCAPRKQTRTVWSRNKAAALEGHCETQAKGIKGGRALSARDLTSREGLKSGALQAASINLGFAHGLDGG